MAQKKWHLCAVWEKDSALETILLALFPKPYSPVYLCMTTVPFEPPSLCWSAGHMAANKMLCADFRKVPSVSS